MNINRLFYIFNTMHLIIYELTKKKLIPPSKCYASKCYYWVLNVNTIILSKHLHFYFLDLNYANRSRNHYITFK